MLKIPTENTILQEVCKQMLGTHSVCVRFFFTVFFVVVNVSSWDVLDELYQTLVI